MVDLVRFSAVSVLAFAVTAAAQQNVPQPVRTIIEQHEQTGVLGKEIVLGTAALPAGTQIGFHIHPGDEIGYVLKGKLILRTRGEADRTLLPGDSFFNARGVVHSLAAAPRSEGGTALSTWIVDKDKPLATAVGE